MTAFEVIDITSTFATTASTSLEGTVPAIIFQDICCHIFLLVMSFETILAELFPTNKDNSLIHLTCTIQSCIPCSKQIQALFSCINGRTQSGITILFPGEGAFSLPSPAGRAAFDRSSV